MPLLSTPEAYGSLNKWAHWLIVGLFAAQLFSGLLMTRLPFEGGALGVSTNDWYNWHKTLGLMALLLALGRVALRRWGGLPDWAPALTEADRRRAHRLEQGLYLGMFLLPLSGFLHVMAGGYGVQFASAFALPNPIGKIEWLGAVGRAAHILGGMLLAAALAGHVGLVLRRGLLARMLSG
jgi:cytochrome b561